MRALVTGGAGFIGSHTVDELLRRGWEVTVLDSLDRRVHPYGKPDYLPREVRFLQGSVCNRRDLTMALQGVDAVFHFAAYQDYQPDFGKFFQVNAVGTALLYELIVKGKHPVSKVVVASSQAVYGEGRYECPSHGVVYPPLRSLEQLVQGLWDLACPQCGSPLLLMPVDEGKVNPHNQYAASKYSEELAALTLGKRNAIPTVALRYSISQGARQSPYNSYSGICRIFCTGLLNGQHPTIYEDGQQLRDYVHIRDVVSANMLMLERDDANYEVFNVGGDRAVSVLEYAKSVAQKFGVSFEGSFLMPGTFRFGDTRHVISDVGKLRSLGWHPTAGVEEIIDDYVSWVSSRPKAMEHYLQAKRSMARQGVVRKSRPSQTTGKH